MSRIKSWRGSTHANTVALAKAGFPQITCGWPYAECEHLHHSAYLDYVRELWADFLDNYLDGVPPDCDVPCEAGVPVLTTPLPYHDWQRAEAEKHPDRDDLGFSWQECDLCGGLAGERYAATALPADPATNPDYTKLSICQDCLCWIANGDEPDFD